MRVRSSDDTDLDIMDASDILANVQDDDLTIHLPGETTMSAKKKEAKPQADEGKAAKKTKSKGAAAPAKSDAKAEKKADKGEKAKGKFGPRELPEGFVGVGQLAKDLGISPAIVRRKLRSTDGVEKPADGWQWKEGSKDYQKVLKALTPAAE